MVILFLFLHQPFCCCSREFPLSFCFPHFPPQCLSALASAHLASCSFSVGVCVYECVCVCINFVYFCQHTGQGKFHSQVQLLSVTLNPAPQCLLSVQTDLVLDVMTVSYHFVSLSHSLLIQSVFESGCRCWTISSIWVLFTSCPS